ncbi:DUF2523 family protein [uncultured Cardiobacterium sp.]|uniref:DUF2523 family protein n=1 Tax=uncultured Cardiobacterium sp. TaxID=417619 RepID=UPI002622E503|nr:DUF2523 family protein [uncultured Cardiobacterium sp.]
MPLLGPILGAFFRFMLVKMLGGLAKAFLFLLAFMVFRLLALIGFSYVIYKGFDIYAQGVLQKIMAQFGHLPEFILQMLSMAQFDVFLSIIFSAYVLKFSIKGASKITMLG